MWKNDLYNSDTTKFLIIFLIGLGLGLYVNYFSVSLLIFFPIILIIALFFKKAIFTYFLLVLFSGYINSFRVSDSAKGITNYVKDEDVKVTGKVLEILPNTEFGIRFVLQGTIKDDLYPKTTTNFIVYSTYDNLEKVKKNSELQIFGKLHIPNVMQLPTDFPEDRYISYYSSNIVLKTNDNKISVKQEGIDWLSWNKQQINFLKLKIESIYTQENAGLVSALILGDRTKLDKELAQNYSKTGIIHVLSVSGLHIALISTILFALLSFVTNRQIKLGIFAIIVFEFICITNFQIPALRAGLAAILFAFFLANKRYPNSLSISSFINLALLIYDPNLVKNPSFLLSGFALYGLAFFYNFFYFSLDRLIPRFAFSTDLFVKPLASTFAASLITSILVAFYFGIYSIVAFLSNIILVPIFSMILLYSILALLLSFIHSASANLLANVVDFLIDLSNGINNLIIQNLPTHISGAYLSMLIASLVAICLIYVFAYTTKRNFIWRSLIAILVISISLVYVRFESTAHYGNNKYLLSSFASVYKKNDLILLSIKSKLPITNQNSINKFLVNEKVGTLIMAKSTNFETEEIENKTKVIRLKSSDYIAIKSKIMALYD